MDTTFIDIPLRESTAQNGHLQQSLDLPKLPDLPQAQMMGNMPVAEGLPASMPRLRLAQSTAKKKKNAFIF
jgi:hypothetical protein